MKKTTPPAADELLELEDRQEHDTQPDNRQPIAEGHRPGVEEDLHKGRVGKERLKDDNSGDRRRNEWVAHESPNGETGFE